MTSRACPFVHTTFFAVLARAAAFSLLLLVFVDAVRAVDFSVSAAEEIYSKSKRSKAGGKYWPDGNFGVVPLGNGLYDFYAANGPKPRKTTGTLDDPGAKKTKVKITGLPKKTFNYVSGGPVYEDPASGARIMIYHAEKHGKSQKDFYSVLGMAVSTDAKGKVFQDLGTIIEPNMQVGQTEVGGGPFAVIGDQLHVYYRDWFPGVTTSELAVARAPLAEVVNNALNGLGTSFSKYYNGDWAQPGRGGLSSYLEAGNPNNGWTAVSYNEYLDELVMVSAQWSPTNSPDLYLSTSPDGVNFSPRQALALDPGEQFYPSLIGTGANPQVTGKEFYVYYTDSQKGAWDRWKDAKLMRRTITFDPQVAPVNLAIGANDPMTDIGDPIPSVPNGWAQISDFRSDFQTGRPADGWTYAWNSNGKTGKKASFTPLVWSDVAQAYNTTGIESMLPSKKKHKDDYLHLTADGGHPGNKKYSTVAGYTIQEEDGAGFYRLADTSIRKTDGEYSKKEDGLNVMIYINDQEIGKSQGVGVDGLLSSFDRDLGQLNVGDTIWVMVDPLKNQYYDSFTGFDFSILKSVPGQSLASNAFVFEGLTVPEPGSAALLMVALAGIGVRRPRRGPRQRPSAA